MKLAIAAVAAIMLCLGSLAARSLAASRAEPALPAQSAVAQPHDPVALASIDRHLHRKLRKLARAH